MRTLAATFETRDEAEAASRRLQTIGVARDRIMLRYVAPGGGETGFFVSAKVEAEQVEPATDILRSRSPSEAPSPEVPPSRPSHTAAVERAAPVTAAHPISPSTARPETSGRPVSLSGARTEAAAPQSGGVSRESEPSTAWPTAVRPDSGRVGRYLVYYALALVAAFMIGALLGLVS